SAVHVDTHFWNADVTADLLPFVERESADRPPVAPVGVLLEAALAGAVQVYGAEVVGLAHAEVETPLTLDDTAPVLVQMVASGGAPGEASFQMLSRKTQAEIGRAHV